MNNFTKKRILCFGDSYTWGYIPNTNHERYPDTVRFPKVLQRLLGEEYEIIEEGLTSRTLVHEDSRPGKEGRNGSQYLLPCLDSHDPIDLVVIMLGTNELKHQFTSSPQEIGILLEKHFITVIKNRKSQFRNIYPRVLIITLPIINENTEYSSQRYIGGNEKSKQLKDIYSKIAKNNNCHLVSASELPVGEDGVHLTEQSHIKLATSLQEKIRSITW